MTTSIDLDAVRREERRQVLRDVVAVLSPNSPWLTDDRFEQYPLDVQVDAAIAQLNAEQCAERLRTKESGLNKKLKSQYEREMKAVTQKCLKDKQAMKIEAEADRKTMGLEIARVKKRLIEAEREKHQATCQTAQSQRDARNLKQQIKETDLQRQEMATAVKKQAEMLNEMEQQRMKERLNAQAEVQKLTERILNLEAKLNNQEALWTDKCTDLMKSAEEERLQSAADLRLAVRDEYEQRVAVTLDQYLEQLQCVIVQQREGSHSVMGLREQLREGYTMMSQIQSLFRDGAYEDVEFMTQLLHDLRSDLNALIPALQKLRNGASEVEAFLQSHGVSCLHDLSSQILHLTDELEAGKQRETRQIEELSAAQAKYSESCEDLEAFRVKYEAIQGHASDLQMHLEEVTNQLRNAQEERSEWHTKLTMEQGRNAELTEQLINLRESQTRAAEALEACNDEKEELRSEILVLKDRHRVEVDRVESSLRQEMLSSLHQLKERCLSIPEEALEQLRLSMMDATTHSCIRSLKVASQLRGTGVQRKRLNSAIQSILTRVQSHLDALIITPDLEGVLEKLKTPSDVTDGNQEREAVQKAMLEIECCLFWLMLDGRIIRERTAEQYAASGVTHQKQWQRRFSARSRRPKGHSSDSTQHSPTVEPSHRSEAEEIVEIIAVLKEYLQNGQTSSNSH